MIRHTFIDKSNTIVKDSKKNFGLNPVAELNYGSRTSRALIHFDTDELKAMYEAGELGDLTNTKHILKLWNCAGQDGVPYDKVLSDGSYNEKERACSFDVILFTLPKDFDAGRGFDFASDMWIANNRSISTKGCNWYYCATNNAWEEEGIYSIETLRKAYEQYAEEIIASGHSNSIVISRQHFDFGNEDFEFDITDWVNKILTGDLINHGLGLAFSPALEDSGSHTEEYVVKKPIYVDEYDNCGNITASTLSGYTEETKTRLVAGVETQEYVGFFTDRTNTFFHPYLETVTEAIKDDRANFYIGKTNRLYLYAVINGEYVNLDEVPTCAIDGTSFPVKQAGKGVYYAEIAPSKLEMTPNTICFDKWSNLALNGVKIDDEELEFVALSPRGYFQVGAGYPMKDLLVPAVSGINDNEELHRDEVRRIVVDFRKKYTTDKKELIDSAYYRIYTKDGDRDIVVYDYSPVEKTFMSNFFYLHTKDLIPGKYYVDFKVKSNGEARVYRDKLHFTIVDDITEFYK